MVKRVKTEWATRYKWVNPFVSEKIYFWKRGGYAGKYKRNHKIGLPYQIW